METPAEPIEESAPPAVEAPPVVVEPLRPAIQAFDFRHPTFLSSGHWRRLRMELDEFVESLAAMLSTYLRLDFAMQVGKLQTLSFNEFTGTLPTPTQLILFKTDPLRGISIVEVRPSIGLAIVDRLLGGPGTAAALDRNLSEMEVALLDQFIEILLGEWCKHWKAVLDLKSQVLGHENNGRFLQTSSGGAMMLLICLEARLGESLGQIQLIFPYNTIEPLVEKLGQEMQANPAPAHPHASRVRWNNALDELPLTLKARWPATPIATRKLLNLKVGDLIELQPDLAERIEFCIGRTVKFQGRLGIHDQTRAVQITKVLKASL